MTKPTPHIIQVIQLLHSLYHYALFYFEIEQQSANAISQAKKIIQYFLQKY